ncbi:MAG: TIGR03826 family flagellar region protein [Candidatus Saccharibacteria bacterium]
MAELRNCPECDRLFAYVGRNLCPKCIDKEEEEFRVVRNYVRDNPGATVFDVSEATGSDEEKILRWLKEGRLVSRGLQSSAVFKCERCGKVITAGRYCNECVNELDSEIRKHTGQPREQRPEPPVSQKDSDRMHILSPLDQRKPGR